ncbi:MAG TPA: exonuclease domain-containing protein [Burkholderiales bacterium]|nr:exonuclease domain-containing protein [Burkholderiales bacterium]
MLDRPLVFLDLETTGATAHHDRITEIGLVEVDCGHHAGEWSSLVNPEMSIPLSIQTLTGITDAMVANAPTFADLAKSLHDRLEGKVLVAHNARFDYGFLRNEFRRLGLRYRPNVLCTVKLSRRLYPQHRRHNLDSLIERHGLSCDSRHRALADARVLWDFTRHIHLDVGSEAIRVAVEDLLKKPVLPPRLPANMLDEIPEGPGVYAFYGDNDVALYVGKSMDLRSSVTSHFHGDHRVARDMRISQEIMRVEWIETAGELGALIKEAQLVKRLTPVHNRRLRRDNDMCAFRWEPVNGPKTPQLVSATEIDFSELDNLYGMFRSRRVAQNALREIADEHGLCHIGIGLEKGTGSCLAYQLKRCRGACVGKESALSHSIRATQALYSLRIRAWPFPARIGIREHDPHSGRTELHVLDCWRYLGTFDSQTDFCDVLESRIEPSFDSDIYTILTRYFKSRPRNVEIVHLPESVRREE